jgi:CelD/BcsL family acetyltransferase involved in cellulose biosynthesis
MQAKDEICWSAAEIEGVSASDSTMKRFADQLRHGGCSIQTKSLEHTWRLELSDGWQGFLSRLTKNQRGQARNLVNRFDKSASFKVEAVHSPEELPQALENLMELHRKRWMASGQPGCFRDPEFCDFIRDACRHLVDSHQVDVTVLQHEGATVASQLFFTDRAKNAYLYQCGRDPAFDKLRVGRSLNLAVIRAACKRGIKSIDYMRGDEVYKSRLAADSTECHCLRIVAPEMMAQIQDALHLVGQTAIRAYHAGVLSRCF